MAEEPNINLKKAMLFNKKRRRTRPAREKRLTTSEKAHICEIYRSGTATYKDLAKQYNCNVQTIALIIKKNKVIKGENSEIVQAKVQQEIDRRLAEDAAVIATRIKETKDESYLMFTGVRKLLWKTITDAKKENKRLDGAVANEIRSLKLTAETLKITREQCYVILNITDKEKEELENRQDFPELKIQELDAETIQKMNEAQRLEMDDIGMMWDDEDMPSFDDKVEEGEGPEASEDEDWDEDEEGDTD